MMTAVAIVRGGLGVTSFQGSAPEVRASFTDKLSVLSAELGTTAIFDGVGGDLPTRIAPGLQMNSTIYIYGFLGGAVPVSVQSGLFMMNLTLRRFSNFESRTVIATTALLS